ncbi:uncharacterized protein LOC126562080 [Anopheles maculipalpis]|uniref:uncharacterized protein LOC126562080 n=1 Tax=Anopheles maculipalpis TaxID=1496333 RepID=UPI0021596503|nr:uncharacterized protein LOC126562080 [Anopheles maculipalpis]
MSETVIISKTSPRQRSQPREPPTAAGEKIVGSKSKATAAASLVMVKELVHRDSSRLVKDLMALLAIREATKEAQSNDGELAKRDEVCPHKNRPGGGDTTAKQRDEDQEQQQQQQQHGGGTKTVVAAVASLLHHTATKEFSSLAGEIIAIADDDTTTSNDDDELMLHADATAAPEPPLHTKEKFTEQQKGLPVTGRRERPVCDAAEHRWDQQRTKADASPSMVAVVGNVSQHQHPTAGCFLSGPVPVSPSPVVCSLERSGTPIPTFTAAAAAAAACLETDRPVVLTLEQKLDKLLDSVVKIKADMHRRIDRLGKRVEQIHLDVQLNIDSTDRALLRNDLLLIGIPHREREDLQQCFRAVCRALEYSEQDIPQVDIRRQRAPGGAANRRVLTPRPGGQKLPTDSTNGGPAEPISPPAPIVVEFMFKTLRDQFYRAYQAKRVLRLTDIGFASDRRFFVNEVLTKYNQKLMAEAVRRKRLGLLHSVYTVDGLVYVQRMAGEKGTKVTSFSSLN